MNDDVTDKLTTEFLNEFKGRLSQSTNEAEVRDAFKTTVEQVLHITDMRLERGRSDLKRNFVIFEFKDKGLFRGSQQSAKFSEAYKQLTEDYIPYWSRVDGHPMHEYVGVCIDGLHIAFVYCEPSGEFRHSALVPIGGDALKLVITYILGDTRKAFSIENVLDDFGPYSPIAKALVGALWKQINSTASGSKTRMLYAEWKKMFAQATNLGAIGQTRLSEHFGYLGLPAGADSTEALFAIHTYNGLVFKFLAAEMLSAIRYTEYSGFAVNALNLNNEDLRLLLREKIEKGRLFSEKRIFNFVDSIFFDWYLLDTTPDVYVGLRKMLATLANVVMPTTYDERVIDAIKNLYESLTPEVLRKNIGEFYTPKWLVEFTLDETGYKAGSIGKQKFLDPTCGSGNFVIHAIERVRAENPKSERKNLLSQVLSQVYGFDLSPLAVIAARTNYLLAIADLLKEDMDVEIPIYLADAVYAPTMNPAGKGGTYREYTIGTLKGNIKLSLPDELVQNRLLFSGCLELMERDIEAGLDSVVYVGHLIADTKGADNKAVRTYVDSLKELYDQVLKLEKMKWNRVWCRIVRNYFASVSIGQVQFVVGNPPWVRWSELPEKYREIIKPTCDQYGIFSSTPFFGGNELDISAMISYTVTDKWLAHGGSLGFIITQIHFQAPSSEGFRKFTLPDGTNLEVKVVHDWTPVKPFPRLANKPAIFVWTKGATTSYPVEYNIWSKIGRESVSENASWADAKPLVSASKMEAHEIPPDGRWLILPPGKYEELKGLVGSSEYTGRKGVTADLNGVYFVEVLGTGRRKGLLHVRNIHDAGRTTIPAKEFDIEEELLYPLLKGAADFSKFEPSKSLANAVIVPNIAITGYMPEQEFAAKYGYAYRYFSEMNSIKRNGTGLLQARSTYATRMLATGAPFYAIYNVGAYTFAPYKVVWAEMAGELEAAVFTTGEINGQAKVVVPDHKVYFADFQNEDESYYVAGLLNSTDVNMFINGFTVKLQVGTIFRSLNIPRFDPEEPQHMKISSIAKELHEHRDEKLSAQLDEEVRGLLKNRPQRSISRRPATK